MTQGQALLDLAGDACDCDVDRDGMQDIVPTGGGSYKLLLMNADLSVKQAITLAPLSGEAFSLASSGLGYVRM